MFKIQFVRAFFISVDLFALYVTVLLTYSRMNRAYLRFLSHYSFTQKYPPVKFLSEKDRKRILVRSSSQSAASIIHVHLSVRYTWHPLLLTTLKLVVIVYSHFIIHFPLFDRSVAFLFLQMKCYLIKSPAFIRLQ